MIISLELIRSSNKSGISTEQYLRLSLKNRAKPRQRLPKKSNCWKSISSSPEPINYEKERKVSNRHVKGLFRICVLSNIIVIPVGIHFITILVCSPGATFRNWHSEEGTNHQRTHSGIRLYGERNNGERLFTS